MKKILYTLLATVSGLVLLFSYRTSLEAVTPTDASAATATSGSAATTTDTGANGSGTSSSTTASGSGLADGTYTGASSQTRYGPVQVQITVSGGQITDAQAVDYPNSNGRDRQINGTAVPRLVSETIQAQSSKIQMVSGATYTSDGYLSSLQSAIDQAHG
ncbi:MULTISPECIES: FMN-binding protein [Microbacterium]|uniref:FMN-binding protein n=1 Tax=Microbacterium TaxID=33882 RepID=UPI000786B0A6|nr:MULTISPECIES: FMN-binding protein [Microbacterium]KYJ98200.1 FMN-binding protein [Microbacterium sp. CH1]MCZ4300002.1 FMN-binding protein [Microbacterium oxydans]UUE21279.1 FMN-binding protein [Microbacterium sp. J1-1]